MLSDRSCASSMIITSDFSIPSESTHSFTRIPSVTYLSNAHYDQQFNLRLPYFGFLFIHQRIPSDSVTDGFSKWGLTFI